jgi:hypothetical protein
MHTTIRRPDLDDYLASYPCEAQALDAYRAALAEWRAASGLPMPRRPPRPVAAMAIGLALAVAALLLAAALGVAVD